MNPHDDLSLSRRTLLTRGFATAATLAAGAAALDSLVLPVRAGAQPSLALAHPALAAASTASLVDQATKNACTLTCAQTIGPCYYNATTIRQDITEGRIGLPTLLTFRVVHADTCLPIQNATIDLWHADGAGVYSAPINTMCNGTDLAARTQTFLRGVQPTDADGWARFDTIFPGWYSGRTPHIHLTVRIDGTEAVTSQFYFDDTLTDSIYRTIAPYTNRPNRDTRNTTDNILGGSMTRMAPYLFDTKLLQQKALVAMKVLAVRTSGTRCSA
jgi:protocatechuate 3,4-dioxygenase beta subunit